MRRQLTHREITGFFAPLVLMAELMMISHTIIHAFLARQSYPTTSLAAFSISFSLQTLLASLVIVVNLQALSFINSRQSVWRVLSFGWYSTGITASVMWTIAFTPVGDWLFGGLLGASEEVSFQAKQAAIVFGFVLPVVVVRQVSNGLIMLNRKTFLISLSTIIRLGALLVGLFASTWLLSGAVAGAAALLFAIVVETTLIAWLARPFYLALPVTHGTTPTLSELWRFTWPLTVNQLSENGIAVLLNVFIGRLANADLALAAFGVVRGLVMLLTVPMRNLAPTAQALVRSRQDLRVMIGFTLRVVGVFTLLVGVLFYTPLREVVLLRVIGLEPELAAYAAPATLLALAVPFQWGIAATFRGLMTAVRRTGSLATSAVWRLIAVMLVGCVTLLNPQANGAVVGVAAMMAALGVEALWLGWRLFGPYAASGLFSEDASDDTKEA